MSAAMTAMTERNIPPYIVFETRAIEDRTASVAEGHYVARDVDYALITPMGGKDVIEIEVQNWLKSAERDARNNRIPIEWPEAFKKSYENWKKGIDEPVTGTAIKNWPAISPAQLETLRYCKIFTIEALAEANEECLNRIGMGARSLKQKAVEWLAGASDIGKLAEELAALKVANSGLVKKNEDLMEAVSMLKSDLEKVGKGAEK